MRKNSKLHQIVPDHNQILNNLQKGYIRMLNDIIIEKNYELKTLENMAIIFMKLSNDNISAINTHGKGWQMHCIKLQDGSIH